MTAATPTLAKREANRAWTTVRANKPRGVVAKQSRAVDSRSLSYRMGSNPALVSHAVVSLSKALYQNCFSPPRSTSGYQ